MIQEFFTMIFNGILVLGTLLFMLFTLLMVGAAARLTYEFFDWLF